MTKLKAYRQGKVFGWIMDDLLRADNGIVLSRPTEFLKNPVKIYKKETDKITLLTEAPLKGLENSKNSAVFWLIKASQIKPHRAVKLMLRWQYKRRLATINRLLENGLPVPYFYAWLCEEGGPDRSYLISEGFPDGCNLALIVREKKQLFDQLVAQGLIVKMVEALADFHQRGYSHGDMKWSNIVVLADKSFRFVDLDHAKKPVLGHRQHLYFKDLARFLIGAFEAGLDEKQLADIVVKYAEFRSLNYNKIIKKIMPQINKISLRKNIQQLSLRSNG